MIDTSYVDVVFPLKGKFLPLDNGYLVFSALSNLCPNIHKPELDKIGIHPIAGKPNPYKQLKLTKRSKLKIRIPLEQIPLIYQFLVEQTFKIGASQFHIGIPDEYIALTPTPSLYSRLVIIRRCIKPPVFIEAAQRQLEELGITGKINLLQKPNGQLQCRQLVMRKKEGTFPLIGYGVRVIDLSESDSLKLQQHGIGGKRKMMCGVFVPSWKNHNPSHDSRASQPKLALDLNASDTTDIHRGAMTGLWMSLKQLEKKYPKPTQRSGNLTWDLTSTTITLDWRGRDFPVIDWLLRQCFQINQKGLIYFVGSESLSLINQIHIHQAIHAGRTHLNQKKKSS